MPRRSACSRTPAVSTRPAVLAGIRAAAVAAILAASILPGVPGQTPQTGSPPAPEAPPDPLTQARDLVKRGSYGKAAEILGKLVDDGSTNASLLAMYGEVLVAAGDDAAAVPVLRRAIEANPQGPRLHFQLATAYSNLGDADDALEAYASELEVNEQPEVHYMARLNRSILLERLSRPVEAAAELEAALSSQPDHPESYGEMARLYLEADRPDKAWDALERGAAAGFSSARLCFNVGAHLYNAERYSQAEPAFRKALELDPTMAEAERSLGSTLSQLGRPGEAAEHFRRYLSLAPRAPDAEEIRKHLAAAGK